MVLCEMPERMAVKRNDHYAAKTKLVTDTIESDLQNQSHPNMPITQERKSGVVRGVKVAEDA
jgi:hypothetical protein